MLGLCVEFEGEVRNVLEVLRKLAPISKPYKFGDVRSPHKQMWCFQRGSHISVAPKPNQTKTKPPEEFEDLGSSARGIPGIPKQSNVLGHCIWN